MIVPRFNMGELGGRYVGNLWSKILLKQKIFKKNKEQHGLTVS